MDNNEQNKTPSGLTEENLKWLEEMAEANTPAPEPTPEPDAEAEPEQAAEKSAEEQELDDILSTDWDHIDLTEEVTEQNEAVSNPTIVEDSVDTLIQADLSVADAELEKILNEASDMQTENADDTAAIDSDNAVSEENNAVDYGEIAEEVDLNSVSDKQEPKKRPKKKDQYGMFGIPHILSTAIWVVLILAIGISLGRVLWVCCADLMAFGKEDQKITITITAEDNIDSISKKLGQAKLIKYPNLFKTFATVTGKVDDICAGTYTLSPKLDYNAMINAMYRADAKREVVEIMFPEGVNCAQIFKILEDNGVCSVVSLEEYAAKGDLNDYWFLEGIARDHKYCLEGYLAPDTYAFYKNDSPRRVLEKFLTEFESRFTDKMRTNFETMKQQYASMLRKNGFTEKYITENQLTIHQAVTLASIVQKEAASDTEGYDIAAVFYARLSDPKIMSLGADITVHYALGDYFYDIKELTVQQLDFDSPYNTRKNKGIPPGPICNMGAQSLYAVLEPNDEKYEYKYFVYDEKNKVHVFSKTEAEHEQKKKELGY